MTTVQREFISAKYEAVKENYPFSMETVKKDIFALLKEVEELQRIMRDWHLDASQDTEG